MRLAGQKKAGFYPAPPEAVAAALTHIECVKPGCNLLDPCAGQGAALKQLCDATKSNGWAIELDEGRAVDVKALFPDAVAPASTMGMKVQGYFDWVWLNPPYDDELGGGSRMEHEFLKAVTPWIKPGGLLCLVVPDYVVGHYSTIKDYLNERYEEVSVMEFPGEHRHYREAVVFAYKADTVKSVYTIPNRYSPLPATEFDQVYFVGPTHKPRRFEKHQLTEFELQRALATSPLQSHLEPPKPLALPRPPLPVGKGHLALLLASGHMDGLVCPPGEEPHVVRGTAQKVQYLKESSEQEKDNGEVTTKHVFSEKILLNIRVLKSDGSIVDLKQE